MFFLALKDMSENWYNILGSRHDKYSTTGYILTVVGAIWAIIGAALPVFTMYFYVCVFTLMDPDCSLCSN